ncbi:hypothetical protein BD309DRAFT_992817 [Dichomitus squalens]|nr:hypothetical protein BD309DRAFT_992817 [Dichomitus squalens]
MPTEVWERVIDLCRTNWRLDGTRSTHPQVETQLRTDGTYETWQMCALVCKSWLPRSRYNLFAEVCISRPEQIDQLLRTLENHPTLAEHVVRLTITLPPDATTGYIPFNRAPLSQILSNCRTLDLRGVDWRHYHPRWHCLHSVPHFSWAHVVELFLPIDYLTPGGAARLIWSHPALAYLTLFHGLSYYGKLRASSIPSIHPSYQTLASRRERPRDACRNLSEVHIVTRSAVSTTISFPLQHLLGHTVTRLTLAMSRSSIDSPDLWNYIACLEQLEILSVSISASEYDPYSAFEDTLPTLMAHVKSGTTLRTLVVRHYSSS